MIEANFASDKGITRRNNEDACLVMPQDRLYVVADGVGGNNSGEVASRAAVTCVADYVRRHDLSKIEDETELAASFEDCISEVNASILSIAREFPDSRGMATTLVICYINDNKAYFVNIGDSRAYLKRGSSIFQVTEDHSYVNTLLKLGVITPDEAKVHERGNVITRAVGAEENVRPDFYQIDLDEGDVILLCTDGLYNEVTEDEMCELIDTGHDMKTLALDLVEQANSAGGKDNITVVCLKNRREAADGQ